MKTIPIDVVEWDILRVEEHRLKYGMVRFVMRQDVVDWFAEHGIHMADSWDFDTEFSNHPDFEEYFRKEWILHIPEQYAVMFKLRFHP